MDFALGLPALGGNLNPAVSMALSRAPSDSYVDFSTLPPASRALGVSTDLLQQLGQQIMPFDSSVASSVDSPYVMGTSILSPLTATSPNLLRSDLPSSMARFPTSAFASLNLVNALDLQHSGQVGQLQATTGADISALLSSSVLPQMPMGGSDAFAAAAASVGSSAGGMQPVPNALSAASVDSAAAAAAAGLFPANIGLGNLASEQIRLPSHNSHPLLHGYQAPFLASPPLGTPPLSGSQGIVGEGSGNALTDGMERAFKNRLAYFAASNAGSAVSSGDNQGALSAAAPSTTGQQQLPPLSIPMTSGGSPADYTFTRPPYVTSPLARTSVDTTGAMSARQQQQQQQPPKSPRSLAYAAAAAASTKTAFDIPYDSNILAFNKSTPLPLSALQGSAHNSPYLSKESRRSSGTSSGRAGVAQLNNDAIPQLLLDVVAEHPELGCPELLYNLLITHVVHDCSRVSIHTAHLFWMRVKQKRMPKFYLMACIADASRSWTLSDELRMALPPNLDEICYALAIKEAPNDDSTPTIVTSLGLLALAAYEFKSARFAPMLEHNCLAYKMMTQIKFRGAAFPWRAVKRRPDANGVDSNYQLLLRAFWRMYIMLYFATEIFRLDAPEDRDFLPEMPERDNYFVQHVFVPDDTEEFGFKMVRPPYQVCDSGFGDLLSIICELYLRQYKIGNRFNRILRGEKSGRYYINYLQEWDRQMLEWRECLPPYLRDDLGELARTTQPLDGRRRRMNLSGLSEDEMWMKRHQWNQDVGRAIEVLYVHMVFDMVRIKAHRIGLMILLHEDLDMVRNFQCSQAFATLELPPLPNVEPVLGSHAEDAEYFHTYAIAANDAVTHMYTLLKFSH
ncbi:hypothetical protein GGI24_004194, partial [Coemansia furcata]